MNIGRAIKTIRAAKGLTQCEVAELADLKAATISCAETRSRNMTFRTLERVSRALNVTAVDVLTLAESDAVASLDPENAKRLLLMLFGSGEEQEGK
jgi:transcriptional regulator with XRE-family HTH domain